MGFGVAVGAGAAACAGAVAVVLPDEVLLFLLPDAVPFCLPELVALPELVFCPF